MGYSHQKTKRTIYDGKTLMPLTVSKQIIKIRKAIENNDQHAGQNLELVFQGYKEIQESQGKRVADLDASCSQCVITYNKMLQNWLKKYDEGTIADKAKTGAFKTEPLKPIKTKKVTLTNTKGKPELFNKDGSVKFSKENDKELKEKFGKPEVLKPVVKVAPLMKDGKEVKKIADVLPKAYADLLQLFNSIATAQEKKTINNGSAPKKTQILSYFNSKA